MNLILKLALSAFVVLLLSRLLPGIEVNNYISAIFVAFTLSILNILVKPFLIIITLPVTIITFGLFLLIVNAIIILLADYFLDGFYVSGWLWAIIFSVLLSVFQSVLFRIVKND